MYAQIETNDVDHWADRFLTALLDSKRKPGLFSGIRAMFSETN
jgi:hypothetical protein